MGHPTKSDEMSLHPQVVVTPFDKWGMDFIGPPSNGKSYILVCTNYLTKWVEVKETKHARDNKVAKFLYKDIFTRYGVPREVVTDQGAQFTSSLIATMIEEYTIRHKKSTSYHPQANGQAEVTNREIEVIFTKTIELHRKDWANHLPEVVWAYCTPWKTTTRFTPFDLVYGKHVVIPIEFEHKTLHTTVQLGMQLSKEQERILHLNQLDELRKSTLQNTLLVQQHRIKWHDKYIKPKNFHVEDWALLYDSRFKDNLGKLQTRWLCPYEIEQVFDNGTITLETIDNARFELLVNGHGLCLYHKPCTKEEFLQ
ncbi:uncharacterized protein LOC131051344 [Cryptomeria japonica]|uniref:uncharacterized protein LOC131051344 n=1 Tax=Cryptomeria japonica TaxID=3369 RepID=UPI0025ACFE03|nr:uncharacterized protein LOC131051344 [Cryptomeria japonica]